MGAVAAFPTQPLRIPIGRLPQSPEQERAVLAGCLLRPGPNEIVALGLNEDDFAEFRHQAIWRAISALISEEQPIDLRTLQAKLEQQGVFDTIGGTSYLAGLDLELPDLHRLTNYAANLKQLRRDRDLMKAMQACLQARGSGSHEDWEVKVQAVADALGNRGSFRIDPVWMSDLDPEDVSFLWRPWIPRRKLTLLEGDPGQGKSFLSAAIATAGSLGYGLGGSEESFEPWKTLFLSAEDGLADTLCPRLGKMGADLRMVAGHPRSIDLSTPEGRGDLALAIAKTEPALVVVDPLVAFVGGRTNTFRANDVRAVLEPLAALAEKYDCAILAIRHLTKAQAGRTLYRGQGSIDFAAAARSVILAGTAGDSDQRAIVQIKCNVAGTASALAYEIRDDGSFVWGGESGLTADDLLVAESNEARFAGREAEKFLLEILRDGPVRAVKVKEAAREAGISEKTLDRRKRKLSVRSVREGFGEGSVVFWQLPIDGL